MRTVAMETGLHVYCVRWIVVVGFRRFKVKYKLSFVGKCDRLRDLLYGDQRGALSYILRL